MQFTRRFLPISIALALGACGSDPVLSDRDGGATPDTGVEPGVDAQVPVIDGGVGDAGPPPVDAGPPCSARDPLVPDDPTAGEWDRRFANPGVGGDLPNVEAFAFGDEGQVYVGGEFTTAGYAPAANVAWWDGSTGWHAMGDGLSGRVKSIAVAPDDSVYAAYAPDDGWEPTRIARWDGTTWTTVVDTTGPIHEVAVLGTTLFAVGGFEQIGGVAANGLARLEGTTWTAYEGVAPMIVPEFGGDPFPGAITAITGTAADAFCIGGTFGTLGVVDSRHVACLSGTTWQARSLPVAPGYSADIHDMTFDRADSSLVAVGYFMIDDTGLNGGSVARWVGDHWELIGGGVMSNFGPGTTDNVRAVVSSPTGLFIGGGFRTVDPADPRPIGSVARWDGTAWRDLGGVYAEVGFGLEYNNVYSAGIGPDGSVYFGGLFTRADSLRVAHVVRWDGTYWSALRTPGETYEGIGGSVLALARYGACDVYVGGQFEYAGEVHANSIARYRRGVGYEALGPGLEGAVQDIAVFGDGRLVAGGEFLDESGTVFRNVALWDGASWSALGGSVDGPLWAVEIDEAASPDDPDLVYVGGEFQNAGEVRARGVAMWNGEEWTAVGGGLHGFPYDWDPTMEASAYPYDLLVDPATGDLIVAGRFQRVGDEELVVNNIARWDGEAWHAYGDGLGDGNGSVLSIAMWNGRLVAAGSFESSGETRLGRVAMWNGTAWEPVGATDAIDGFAVSALHAVGDTLFAGGVFQFPESGSSHVAAFDGTTWRSLGAGLSDLVEALVSMDEGVYIGGTFDRAGTSPAVGLSLWQYE